MTIILTRGLPASGKTTWAKEYVRTHPNTIRFNNDEFSYMTTGWDDGRSFKPMDRDYLRDMRKSALAYGLDRGWDIVLDNTNLHPGAEEEARDESEVGGNVPIEIVVFDTSALECMERNVERGFPISNNVILSMYEKYHDLYDWMKWS